MPRNISISAFFPCYNDGGTIASMVIGTFVTLEDITDDYEVIVIDDGSTDFSREILKRLAKDYPRLRLVFHEKNRGYGGALKSGFASATKDYIFYTDGDAQYDVRELKRLTSALNSDVDVVQGYKIKRLDPWYRTVIGKTYQYSMKRLFGLKIRDVDCDFRLIRRTVFDRVCLERTSGVICLEMIKKIQDAGFKFAEVPVNHFFRAYGRSQFFNFKRVFRVGMDVMALWRELVWRKG
ncbi:MAG: glycosyltransferase family 2 protein [Deltaproteobacteria bacterium]|nr:glycosyltransferase family 2 protein [Deltaproteobacteria bacterium]